VLNALMSIGRLMRHRFQGDGMDLGTFFLLKELASHDAMRVTELAALANLDASKVSRHVQQLDRAGLIERTQDPDDGRAQRVALTDRGRELLSEGIARRREVLGKSFEEWDRSDIEVLDKLLARFVGKIENISAELEKA
jgi:DNA-binding MarR family transcriptional regulator